MSVVPTRNIVDPCLPVIEETCTIQTVKKTYTFLRAVFLGAIAKENPLLDMINPKIHPETLNA